MVASSQTLTMSSAPHCSRIFSVPFRVVSDGRNLNAVVTAGRHQAVARYELPVICLVGARLACDDDVFAMVFDSFSAEAVCRMSAVRVVRVFPVESSASIC